MAEDIAIVTNSENESITISQSDAINIFLGRYRRYDNGQTAKPYDNAALKTEFYKKLVNKSPAQIKAYWARLIFSGRTMPPKTLETNKAVISQIKNNKLAISYIPLAQVTDDVKILLLLKDANK